MDEKIITIIKTIPTWYRKYRTHSLTRVARWLFGLGLPLLSVWFIAQQITSGYESIGAILTEVHIPTLLWATTCITTATMLGALEWIWLVNALGAQLDIVAGLKIHLLSNLTKYIPGFVWPYLGKAYLSTQMGISSSIAGLSLIIELAAIMIGGFALAFICVPFSNLISWSAGARASTEFIILIIIGLGFVVANHSTLKLPHWKTLFDRAHLDLKCISWQNLFLACMAILLTWGILGMGFVFLYTALSSVQVNEAQLIIALVAAMLIGQLIVFVPLGMGVREAILVAVLSPQVSAATITVVAVLFRMIMMGGEILWALGGVGLATIHQQ